MTNKALFLDTSIQISRKSWDEEELKKINEMINNYIFPTTSSYVKLEFKQSHIQDLVYLHRNLVMEQSFAHIFLKIHKLNAHPGHKRKLSNMSEALAGFFTETKSFTSDGNLDKELAEKIVLYLEIVIEQIWDWFDNSVKYVSDFTGCIRAKEPPKKKTLVYDATIKKCKSRKIYCKLNTFFKDREEDFKKILSQIRQLDDSKKNKPEELNNIASVIEEGLKNPDKLCDRSLCQKLGDALIAVEASHFKELFTKDIDQSEIISPSIGLKSNLLS